MCADLFSMVGEHGDRKEAGHKKKSLLELKHIQTVDRLYSAIVNFTDII